MIPIIVLFAALAQQPLTCVPCVAPHPVYRHPVVSPLGLITVERAIFDQETEEACEACRAAQAQGAAIACSCDDERWRLNVIRGTPTGGTAKFLREDGTWTTPDCGHVSSVLFGPTSASIGGTPIVEEGTLALGLGGSKCP